MKASDYMRAIENGIEAQRKLYRARDRLKIALAYYEPMTGLMRDIYRDTIAGHRKDLEEIELALGATEMDLWNDAEALDGMPLGRHPV